MGCRGVLCFTMFWLFLSSCFLERVLVYEERFVFLHEKSELFL